MSDRIRVLCLGDVVGKSGRVALRDHLKKLKQELQVDFTIVNVENACGGVGIDPKHAYELKDCGIDVMTLGDHTWAKKDINVLFEEQPDWIIRPCNYPEGAPGKGYTTLTTNKGVSINVVNAMGRVFMDMLIDCPFKKTREILDQVKSRSPLAVIDFHAEASSEKIAFGRFLNGHASLVFGTHTHVQTADDCVLPGGTGYITDLGMCGATDGVIGMDADVALFRFNTGRPKFYEAAEGPGVLHGVVAELEVKSGKALKIQRLRFPQQP